VDHDEKRALARYADISTEAASFRLRAARLSLGLTQKEMADEVGAKPGSYSTYETGRVHPPLAVIRHLYRAYNIDFNFILYGDFRRLPADTQERIFDALLELQSPEGRAEGSG
jgi:transcriptional regulator with XRE-family HTH domain